MDNQSQRPVAPAQQPNPQAAMPAAPAANNPRQPVKPKLALSDQEAQALLTINDVQVARKSRSGPSLIIMISIAVLIVIIILVSYLVGRLKPAENPKPASSSGTKSSSQSASNPTDNTSNQINQDVNSCSDPLTAISEC